MDCFEWSDHLGKERLLSVCFCSTALRLAHRPGHLRIYRTKALLATGRSMVAKYRTITQTKSGQMFIIVLMDCHSRWPEAKAV